MKVKAATSNAEIFLYGYIGFELSAGDFMESLRAQEVNHSDIDIRINSGGGDVFEGLPMYNLIAQSKANITTIVDGLAASMASVIMCAGKKVKAASNAMIMVHGPRGGDYNTVENLETVVEMMRKIRADLAKIYATRTKKTEQWVLDNWLMDGKDHWFTAEEALQAGLIDEIYQSNHQAPQAGLSRMRIAAFYNQLFETPKPNNLSMKKVIAVLNGSKLVSLAEASTEELVAEAVTTLTLQLSNQAQAQAQRDQEIARLKQEAEAAKTIALTDKATALVEAAQAARKIVAAQKENFLKLASASEEGYSAVKQFIDNVKPYEPVTSQLKATGELPNRKEDLVKLYDEYANGIKLWAELSEEQIKTLWKAKHGKDISDSTLKALSAK